MYLFIFYCNLITPIKSLSPFFYLYNLSWDHLRKVLAKQHGKWHIIERMASYYDIHKWTHVKKVINICYKHLHTVQWQWPISFYWQINMTKFKVNHTLCSYIMFLFLLARLQYNTNKRIHNFIICGLIGYFNH